MEAVPVLLVVVAFFAADLFIGDYWEGRGETGGGGGVAGLFGYTCMCASGGWESEGYSELCNALLN